MGAALACSDGRCCGNGRASTLAEAEAEAQSLRRRLEDARQTVLLLQEAEAATSRRDMKQLSSQTRTRKSGSLPAWPPAASLEPTSPRNEVGPDDVPRRPRTPYRKRETQQHDEDVPEKHGLVREPKHDPYRLLKKKQGQNTPSPRAWTRQVVAEQDILAKRDTGSKARNRSPGLSLAQVGEQDISAKRNTASNARNRSPSLSLAKAGDGPYVMRDSISAELARAGFAESKEEKGLSWDDMKGLSRGVSAQKLNRQDPSFPSSEGFSSAEGSETTASETKAFQAQDQTQRKMEGRSPRSRKKDPWRALEKKLAEKQTPAPLQKTTRVLAENAV